MNSKFKLFHVNHPLYQDHQIPTIPEHLKKSLTKFEQDEITKICMDEYKISKKHLDQAIAEVACQDKNALKFAGNLAERVLILIDLAVSLGLDKSISLKETDFPVLEKYGVNQLAIEARIKAGGFLKELKSQELKSMIFGSDNSKLIDKGRVNEAGYVGMSPLAIQNAAKGNLREKMYIPYKVITFIKKLINEEQNVALINAELAKKYNWKVDQTAVQDIKAQLTTTCLFQYGAYASSRNGSRENKTDKERAAYINKNNPRIVDLQKGHIPLSKREMLIQAGGFEKNLEEKIVQWQSGAAWMKINSPNSHPSLKAADEAGEPMITGISGSLDLIMTLSYYLGLFSHDDREEKMRDALVACIGWMVPLNDHSVHEILSSAKTFGLEYISGPEAYKQIRPNNNDFMRLISEAQHAKGHPMPAEIFSEKYIRKLIEKINETNNDDNEKREDSSYK